MILNHYVDESIDLFIDDGGTIYFSHNGLARTCDIAPSKLTYFIKSSKSALLADTLTVEAYVNQKLKNGESHQAKQRLKLYSLEAATVAIDKFKPEKTIVLANIGLKMLGRKTVEQKQKPKYSSAEFVEKHQLALQFAGCIDTLKAVDRNPQIAIKLHELAYSLEFGLYDTDEAYEKSKEYRQFDRDRAMKYGFIDYLFDIDTSIASGDFDKTSTKLEIIQALHLAARSVDLFAEDEDEEEEEVSAKSIFSMLVRDIERLHSASMDYTKILDNIQLTGGLTDIPDYYQRMLNDPSTKPGQPPLLIQHQQRISRLIKGCDSADRGAVPAPVPPPQLMPR